MDNSCNQYNQNKTGHSENFLHPEEHIDDVKAMHKEESTFGPINTNNLKDTTEVKAVTNNSQITEKDPVLVYYLEENPCLQTDLQLMENNEKYKLDITPSNGPSTVQKEHLLEMASEVANVLTDDINDSESTLSNLDAKYHYQFVNTYLEEQKQLVNDLHIRVSRYVSIAEFTVFLLYCVLIYYFWIQK